MRIERIELYFVEMPLVRPFRAAHGAVSTRAVVLVQIVTDTGSGWGECSALPDAGYSAETASTAYRWLGDVAAPRIVGTAPDPDVPTGDGVGAFLDDRVPASGHPMARAALEGALLDAVLRTRGESLASHLGSTRARVAAGATIGITDTLDELLAAVARACDDGYTHAKLKIQPGWDLEPVRVVRTAFPDLPLRVDANGSYARGDTELLLALDAKGLAGIEQPLPADDLRGHANLARLLQTAVALDESIDSAAALDAALAMGACDVLCLKPARVGGYTAARQLHDRCVAAGVRVFCGGMLETGIGRATALAVAALPGCTEPADLAASDRYFAEDLTAPFVLDAGHLTVPTGPGIGVDLRTDVLDEATMHHDTVRA